MSFIRRPLQNSANLAPQSLIYYVAAAVLLRRGLCLYLCTCVCVRMWVGASEREREREGDSRQIIIWYLASSVIAAAGKKTKQFEFYHRHRCDEVLRIDIFN